MNYYSIIRYVPNPLNAEFINIGIYAFNESEIKVKFLEKWDRAQAFGNEDISFLIDFKGWVSDRVLENKFVLGDNPKKGNNLSRLQELSNSWMNSIQIREPCASLKSLEAIIEDSDDWLINL